ncbi:MAG: 6,7-dimethyl-8-ribityllumazine synthase [Fidelibacterota bacterium]|nr:MAG: 6,7-dimethyl-8-ribityllumazine synthase [Candidatus Neomarinimicrobiota bacterium]
MASTIIGELTVKARTIAVVASRFNSMITQQLLAGAEDMFIRHGGDPGKLTVVWVPGSFEIPNTVKRLADSGKYDGVLALGALVKGSTLHFDVLAQQVTRALTDLSLQLSVPISFGVLTTLSLDQALERAGTKAGNRGAEAMQCLIEMISLASKLS